MLQQIVDKLKGADSIVLSTHKQCDGDGLGAQIALFHGLVKAGKKVRILNVDETPKKYDYLQPQLYIQAFENQHDRLGCTDLALIFDTNDHRLVEPLFSELQKNCRDIFFIDHHPVLLHGPAPTVGSFIDINAASTGEIVFHILKALGIGLDPEIARALYTSVVFDTQLFRFIRNSPTSHLITAELLKHEKNPDEVHRRLFANYTVQKVAFLAKALSRIEYYAGGQLAVLRLHAKDLLDHNLDLDESRDVIDLIMNIESLHAAVLFREDGPNYYKLSLRSKGLFEVLATAETLGGGGHLYSAGAYLQGNYEALKQKVVSQLSKEIALLTAKKDESA